MNRLWIAWLMGASVLVLAHTPPASAAGNDADPAAPTRIGEIARFAPYIVNGVPTSSYPSVGALLIPFDPADPSVPKEVVQCSGTMIGCDTFLTAAHCVCPFPKTGAQCQGENAPDPAGYTVFLPHGGFFGIASIAVQPAYELHHTSDIAVVRLSSPVTGMAPSPINTVDTPPAGTPGTIVGFGRSGGDPNVNLDFGLKRVGKVTTAPCPAGIPNTTHVCWAFAEPLGPPGENSGICNGDSGGPLFVASGSSEVVAGTTSDHLFPTCLPPDVNFDDNVFNDRAWIQSQAGTDLDHTRCGDIPPAGTANTAIFAVSDQLDAATPDRSYSMDVPSDAILLRVALNGHDAGDNNFDLHVQSPATSAGDDCTSMRNSQYEFCEIANPVPGTWRITVTRAAGEGSYQLTATTFRAPTNACAGDCGGNRKVTLNEIITLVNIALGRDDVSACWAGDANGNGTITIDEIVRAVNAALTGCGVELEEAAVAELQAAMEAGWVTALDLVDQYLARIESLDRSGPALRAVIEINPDARFIAQALDVERQAQGSRGPLHGIPVLLKDNIDTGDQMLTTAGSLALLGAPATADATVAERLRHAGAVLLGKTNLSEWANMRSLHAASGWSARGGQTLNPYVLDHSPSGSSSGSAVAVAANLCTAAIGTETDGSVVSPAAANGVVGLKPTVGLTSRAGVVPIAHTQDTVGVLARTVADAATVLDALVGPDPRDPATQASAGHIPDTYTQFLDADGLRAARIGIPRQIFFGKNAESEAIIEQAIAVLRAAGATLIDPADVPSAAMLASDASEFTVLLYEFKADLNGYLATRSGIGVATLADLIAFNTAHADTELALFGQEIFELANPLGSLDAPAYLNALAKSLRLSRDEGLDAVMDQYQLDALVAPTGPPAWVIDYATGDPVVPYPLHSVAARAGYPVITVPAGFTGGLPVGVSFVGRAFSEPVLLRLAYAFEQATHARRAPALVPHPGA